MSDRKAEIEYIQILEELERRSKIRNVLSYYPDSGPLRRELYPKHMKFFSLGATALERLFLAANRVGKTEGAGGFETTLHATGLYPHWWPGRKFDRAIDGWAAGDTTETVRDIIQTKLVGNVAKDEIGTGLIPKEYIADITRRRGVSDALDAVFIKHVSGGVSQIAFKSYDQRRHSFQGTKKDLLWLDEEPPIDVYTECLLRLTGTSGEDGDDGSMILTFTPLSGMSETVMSFLRDGEIGEQHEGSKVVVMATWDDVPHLTEATKKKLYASMLPYQRDARTRGIPTLGSGAIYPVPESDLVVPDFPIPEHWPRFFAMDVGWNRTSAGWYAHDTDTDTVYRYSEHYRGEAEPVVHSQAIKARGDWIPGVIDPAARGRGQNDGTQLLQMYLDLGLDLEVANNAVDTGLLRVWERMSSGRFKVFESCQNWRHEFRLYRRDEKGRIVKEKDHAMDEMRYAIMSGIERAKVKPTEKAKLNPFGSSGGGWMGG